MGSAAIVTLLLEVLRASSEYDWSFSRLATYVRMALFAYFDLADFLNRPEKHLNLKPKDKPPGQHPPGLMGQGQAWPFRTASDFVAKSVAFWIDPRVGYGLDKPISGIYFRHSFRKIRQAAFPFEKGAFKILVPTIFGSYLFWTAFTREGSEFPWKKSPF